MGNEIIYWIYTERWKEWEAVVIMLFCFVFYLCSCFMFFTIGFYNIFRKTNGRCKRFLWQGTTSANLEDDGDISFLLEVMIATVAFFEVVVVVLLTSLDAMFSFHSYRHSDNNRSWSFSPFIVNGKPIY